MNAATHQGAPRVKPKTVISANSQNTFPERISGTQPSQAATATSSGNGRRSQAMPIAAAPTKIAQKTGHGRKVNGQISGANNGL